MHVCVICVYISVSALYVYVIYMFVGIKVQLCTHIKATDGFQVFWLKTVSFAEPGTILVSSILVIPLSLIFTVLEKCRTRQVCDHIHLS